MHSAPSNSHKPDWRQHACIQMVIRFADGNQRKFYSRDIDKKGTWMYHHTGHWLMRFKNCIETESPPGWRGRVEEAAIFHSFYGARGDKICQWSKHKGGWQPLA